LVSSPLLGNVGSVRVTRSRALTNQAAELQLTSSTPTLVINPSVQMPQGVQAIEVPFQLTGQFNPQQVASIKATLDDKSGAVQVVKATQSWIGPRVGYNGYVPAVQAGRTTSDYEAVVSSAGGYQGTVMLSCDRLPKGATCDWQPAQVEVQAGGLVRVKLFVHTSVTTPGGNHTFDLVASDGSQKFRFPASLTLNGITFSLSRPKRPARNANVNATAITVNVANFGVTGMLQVSCRSMGFACQTSTPNIFLTENNGATFELYLKATRAQRLKSLAPKQVEIEISGVGFNKVFNLTVPN
jgi:hypothetical protein